MYERELWHKRPHISSYNNKYPVNIYTKQPVNEDVYKLDYASFSSQNHRK